MFVKGIKIETDSDDDFEVAVCKDKGDIILLRTAHPALVISAERPRDVLCVMDDLLTFYSPSSWTIKVFLHDKNGTQMVVQRHYDIEDEDNNWGKEYRTLMEATWAMSGLTPDDCDDHNDINHIYTPTLNLTSGFIINLFNTSKRQQAILALKGKECPVLHETLTIETGVVLKCGHAVSKDAWLKIVPNDAGNRCCPLCRHQHLSLVDVLYHPSRMTTHSLDCA